MEVVNDLLHFKNMKIVQNDDFLKFSLDAVLLAHFVTISARAKEILDIGTGNAPIPLILSTRTKAKITGVEIQKESFLLAEKSVKMNHLTEQIHLVHMDIKSYYQQVESDTFDVITCNPPYFKMHTHSRTNLSSSLARARHEMNLDLEDLCLISRKLLKNGGVLSIVHRPERLVDIITLMRKYNIEPKKIRYIFPNKNKEANILLIEGRKNGRPGLKVLSPIYTNHADGSYTEEICKFFGENE